MKKYNLVVCGGTFDHLHKGHRGFLLYGLSISRKLLIGLTTERYVKAKRGEEASESYRLREHQLGRFLHEENAIDRVLIEPIDDIFIPKAWESLPIEAIIVSKDSISGAKRVNLKRKEQGKYPLKIETFPLIKSEDNEYISSSKIRRGQIDREGLPYINPIWFRKKLLITEKLRTVLKKPFGTLLRRRSLRDDILKHNVILVSVSASRISKVVRDSGHPPAMQALRAGARMTHNPYVITVGDVTTKTFNKLHLDQDISVIDFKVARKRKFSSIKELGFLGHEKIIKVTNPAGSLTPALFKVASEVFKFKTNNRLIIIQIEGEEDLSVLPLILSAPLGSIIFYGQPEKGVVKIKVEPRRKEIAYKLVSQFKVED